MSQILFLTGLKITYHKEDRGLSSQVCILNGHQSRGSLGPILFLIYINDIVNDICSNIRLFADYTSLYIIVTDPETSAELLTLDLTKIEDWTENG